MIELSNCRIINCLKVSIKTFDHGLLQFRTE